MRVYDELIQPPVLLDRNEYPCDFGHVAETIGDVEACSLLWYLPAFQIRHIPKKPSRQLKHQIIKNDYDGNNAASLAVRLNMLYAQVKTIYNNVKDRELNIEVFKNIYIAQVAEKCGSVVALKLLEEFPGQALHIPRRGRNVMTQKLIKKEFTGYNQIELAVKFNLSIACVYRFLKKQTPKNQDEKAEEDDDILISDGIRYKQLSLFK